ncbi:MAG: hypothetical protein H6581_02630 [Bacteroidia bacterium]|nr:hypothetical protein [Bacteroidia bacterium]
MRPQPNDSHFLLLILGGLFFLLQTEFGVNRKMEIDTVDCRVNLENIDGFKSALMDTAVSALFRGRLLAFASTRICYENDQSELPQRFPCTLTNWDVYKITQDSLDPVSYYNLANAKKSFHSFAKEIHVVWARVMDHAFLEPDSLPSGAILPRYLIFYPEVKKGQKYGQDGIVFSISDLVIANGKPEIGGNPPIEWIFSSFEKFEIVNINDREVGINEEDLNPDLILPQVRKGNQIAVEWLNSIKRVGTEHLRRTSGPRMRRWATCRNWCRWVKSKLLQKKRGY